MNVIAVVLLTILLRRLKLIVVESSLSCTYLIAILSNIILLTKHFKKNHFLQDFAVGLSILLKGSLEDRLRWTFQVYDLNKDGVLSRGEVRDVTAAVRRDRVSLYND